jgi:hypothetical protein
VARFFRDRVLNGAGNAAAVGTFIGTAANQALGTALSNGTEASGTNHTTNGWGIGATALMPVTKKVNLILNAVGGAGLGRYSNSSGSADVTLDNNLELVSIKTLSTLIGLEIHPRPKLDVNLYVGQEYYERAQYALTSTALPGNNKAVGFVPIGYGNINYAPGTNNKQIQEVEAAIVYRWYRGPYGTFQTQLQLQYFDRITWAGLSNTSSTTGLTTSAAPTLANCKAAGVSYTYNNCTAVGWNTVGFLGFKYILP